MNTPFEQKTSPLAQVIDNILNERLDDIPLLIRQMIKMNLPQIIDSFIPAGHNQRDLSWGWTTTVWLAYILSEGDHRKVAVQTYVKEMQASLSALTGQAINPLDFDDNRLTH